MILYNFVIFLYVDSLIFLNVYLQLKYHTLPKVPSYIPLECFTYPTGQTCLQLTITQSLLATEMNIHVIRETTIVQ